MKKKVTELDHVLITFEDKKSGKKILCNIKDLSDGTANINFDFGEGGANDHDGHPHAGIFSGFMEFLKAV